MNRNSIFQQNVKCSLANYRWLTCLIEIKVGYWQLLQVLVWVLVCWGEKQHTSLKYLVFLCTKICLFILAVLGLSCGTQDLQSLLPHVGSSFPDQRLNPGPLTLGARSLSSWTAREVPSIMFLMARWEPRVSNTPQPTWHQRGAWSSWE